MLFPSYSLKSDGIYAEYDFRIARKACDNFIGNLPYGGEEQFVRALRQAYLGLYASYLEANQKDFFLDKTPRYYFILPELARFFPNAKYILLTRNPLAVLNSIVETRHQQCNWHNLAYNKHDLISGIDLIIEAIQKHDQIKSKTVRYEDLLLNSETILKELCNFIGLPFEDNLLRYHEIVDEIWIYGDQKNVYEKNGLDESIIDKWENNLHIPQLWRILYDYLEFLGEKRLSPLNYSYEENLEILMKNVPMTTPGHVMERTFSLFSFLDNTRDFIIENSKLKRKEKNLTEQIDKQRTTIEVIQRKLREKSTAIETCNKTLIESSREIKRMEAKLNKNVIELNDQLKRKSARLEIQDRKIAAVRERIKRKDDELKEAKQKLNKVYEQLEIKEERFENQKKNIGSLKEELRILRLQIEELKQQHTPWV